MILRPMNSLMVRITSVVEKIILDGPIQATS